jgi:hypothetical protein
MSAYSLDLRERKLRAAFHGYPCVELARYFGKSLKLFHAMVAHQTTETDFHSLEAPL